MRHLFLWLIFWIGFIFKRQTKTQEQSLGNDPQVHHPLSPRTESQAHISNLDVSNSHTSVSPFKSSSIQREQGEQDLEILDIINSSVCSISEHPWQDAKKPVDTSLDVFPGRALALGFRAEIFVELNMPYINDKHLWLGRQHLTSLRGIDLSNSNLKKLPDLSEARELTRLNLEGCTNLVVASSVQYLTKLEQLNLKGSTSLLSLPILTDLKLLSSLNLSDCSNLKGLPLSIGFVSGLVTLDLSNCKRLQQLPAVMIGMESLKSVNISGCSKLLKQISGTGMEKVFSVHPSLLVSDELKVAGSFGSTIQGDENVSEELRCDSSSASVSRLYLESTEVDAFPEAEAAPLEQHATQHSFHTSSQLRKEASCYDADAQENHLLEGRIMPEINPQQSLITEREETIAEERVMPQSPSIKIEFPSQMPFREITGESSTTNGKSGHWKELEGYMTMSVEAIHEAGAFEDIERTVNSLIQQTPILHNPTVLEDLICCLEEFKVSIPDTVTCKKIAIDNRSTLQAESTRIDASLAQAEEQCCSLLAMLAMLSKEEANLEAEIQYCLTKRAA